MLTEPVTVFTIANNEQYGDFYVNGENVKLPVIQLQLLETKLFPAGTTNVRFGKVIIKLTEPFLKLPASSALLERTSEAYNNLIEKVREDSLKWLEMEMPELYENYMKGLEILKVFFNENPSAVKEEI